MNEKIIRHFYNPYGYGNWYVLKAEELENGDILFYGLVDLMFKEFGSFTLSELIANGIEEDEMWIPKNINML